jgi:hypothetical protein
MDKLLFAIGWTFGTFVMRPAIFIQKIVDIFCISVFALLILFLIF